MTDFVKKQKRFTAWWDKARKEERYELFRRAFGEGATYEMLDLLETEAWEIAFWFSHRELNRLFEALPDEEGSATGFRQEGRCFLAIEPPLATSYNLWYDERNYR